MRQREQFFAWTQAPTPASPTLAAYIQMFAETDGSFSIRVRTNSGTLSEHRLDEFAAKRIRDALRGVG